jgi:hypothetical protein
VSATPDEPTPTPERKETELRDLPATLGDDAASDVKGGAASTLIPCVRIPKGVTPYPPNINPCWRPGGV